MKTKLTALMLCASMLTTPAIADDLTVTQKVVAAEMNRTVMTFAVAGRLQEMCAKVEVNFEKLSERRDQIMKQAQSVFSSQEDFMRASGSDEQVKMGESVRQYYLERGVSWESPATEYCELAEALIRTESPLSQYFSMAD